jgi:hypothetical protein
MADNQMARLRAAWDVFVQGTDTATYHWLDGSWHP